MSKLVSQHGKAQISALCCVGQPATLNLMQCNSGQEMVLGADLTQLLQEYADVFEVPTELPPQRSFDHKIPLKEDNVTINIRPYRYPPSQKDTIEAMVKELLDLGVIRPRNIKDKFPIPVIEELIDELQGAHVFSKLDLRSGYHQIRMCESDVYKTAFKTHKGHYEFVVMSFGLTNAPSTFQALMNSVFKPFLMKFTLVFFDDSLVYSPFIPEHIEHLRMVLQVMREHHLFAKQSKCVFGTTQVEYLRHVISAKGVSTDPKDSPRAMIQSLVLALPNFDEEFVIETDASGIGLGAVLQQNKHLIAYLSKTLAPKHQSLSTYEKELLAVVLALQKWRGYLLDRHFKIRTNHFSLKYVLDQRLTTPFQSKWLSKLLGFDYEIEYKKGADNAAADALSSIERQGVLFSMLVGTSNELLDVVIATWTSDLSLQAVIKGLQDKTLVNSKYACQNDQLMRKDKWVVGKDVELRKKLIDHFHGSVVGGHSGVSATTKRLITYFYWKGLRKMVKEWVRTCDVCQRNKSDLSAYPVVVDRQSKYAHFLPLAHPYTASQVAQLFLDNVYKLHGLPKTIVSDRDKVFMSLFWQSLFKKLQVKLKMSTAYHPQTDGQTEIVNKCLESYLRCMTGETPKDWVKWVPLAEYWYNTNYHSVLDITPYEVVYGQTPPMHIPYMAKDNPVEAVDRTL
ncbi:putative mitochondrial protein [Tanacetum coccineum]